MWPFGRKKKRFIAGEGALFLRDHGWYQFATGAWGHKDHPGPLTFRQAMMHGKIQYETQQARERYRRNASLYDPNSFIGRIIRRFRLFFRMK